MRTITKLIAAAAITAAPLVAITSAAGAYADADTINERAFVEVLSQHGISYSSEDAALAVGYATCNALDAGATPRMIVREGVRAAAGFYTRSQVEYITGAAVAAFCPEYVGQLV
jgi:hypothetical protein